LPESEEEEGRCEPEMGFGSGSLTTERLVAIAFSEVKLSEEREKMERSGGMRRKEGTTTLPLEQGSGRSEFRSNVMSFPLRQIDKRSQER
jgi:hypothetical protein